jgi:cytochrome oxidase Cu insertion factor (SCO1/SenC/PrrC family)
MKERQGWVTVAFMVLGGVLLLLWGLRVYQLQPSPQFLRSGASAPDFFLNDQEGKKFSSESLQGKIWVADFIFTRCAGTCPILSGQMRQLARQYQGNPDLRLVTFTVDPQYDKVPVMARYAQNLGADPRQWLFLTGEKQDIYSMIRRGFKLTAEEDPQGTPGFEFIHTTRMVLVDRHGKIRGLYEGDEDKDIKNLKRDLRHLLLSWGGE